MARSGHLYNDLTGVAYEYPAGRYERWIQPGERFVYQVPKVGYTGTGVIGEVRASARPGRLVCDVLSVRLFDQPVPLKSETGEYFEADPLYWRKHVYWGQGVRPLSDERFDAIARTTRSMRGADPDPSATAYADPATAWAIEEYSVAVASAAVHKRFNAPVTVMPHSNPGFDLLVGTPHSPIRFIEVKGTQSSDPVFFISDGERRFSIANASSYTLYVVSGINVRSLSHAHETYRDGAVGGAGYHLRPHQWRGQLLDA